MNILIEEHQEIQNLMFKHEDEFILIGSFTAIYCR